MLNDVPVLPRDLRLREQQGALQPSGASPPVPSRTAAIERLFDARGALPFEEAPSPLTGALVSGATSPATTAPWLSAGGDGASLASFADANFAAPLERAFEAPATYFPWDTAGEASPLDKLLARAPERLAQAYGAADMAGGGSSRLGELAHLPFPHAASADGTFIGDAVGQPGIAAHFASDLEAASPFRQLASGRSAAVPWPMLGDALAAEAAPVAGAPPSESGHPIDAAERPSRALPGLVSAPRPGAFGSVTESGMSDPLEALPRLVEDGYGRLEQLLAAVGDKVTAVRHRSGQARRPRGHPHREGVDQARMQQAVPLLLALRLRADLHAAGADPALLKTGAGAAANCSGTAQKRKEEVNHVERGQASPSIQAPRGGWADAAQTGRG